MNILFLGDIVGELGFQAVVQYIPVLKEKLNPDVIIANAENIDNGRGISIKYCKKLFNLGINIVTLGNHFMANPGVANYLDIENNIIRPINYENQPGKGLVEFRLSNGKIFIVLNLLTRMHMNDTVQNPFSVLENVLKNYSLSSKDISGIFIDLHGTSTFEKIAIAHFVDGKVSTIVGTHTHTPTADARILPNGTGYQSDAGMCGTYDSCLGMNKNIAIKFFLNEKTSYKWKVSHGVPSVCGTFVVIDETTKLTKRIEAVRIGGALNPSIPILD